MKRTALEALSAFSAERRQDALAQLLATQPAWPAETTWLNMHLHTFFSFNGEGWSPSRLAWEARQRGLYAAAICDFDVLDGLDEFLTAADLLGLRGAVGFESRTFFSEYGSQEINSPGEPGVFYFMGMGFVRPPADGSPAARVLADMLSRSHERNRAMIARINAHLGSITLDYDTDVIPLTPAGNATERHIVRAYHEKALQVAAGDPEAAADLWSGALGLAPAALRTVMADANAFADTLRSKLMKQGGPGYAPPTEDTFPDLETVIAMIRDCRAIPMATWLDGTSEGESDPGTQLDCLMEKGVAAVNIIPDRNWNIADAASRRRKVQELNRYIAAAHKRNLPINVGTELNKPGQRFVDDFSAPALAIHHDLFSAGAQVMVGHSRLLRYADVSYTDAAIVSAYPSREQRNSFFASVGALPVPSADMRRRLADMSPEHAFACLADCAGLGRWQP